jgi:hypothetical protein
MTHLDLEFSGMIAFDLRKPQKVALLLSGGGKIARHVPVLAIPRSAIDRVPPALNRRNGWPQALPYGSEEHLLFDLTRRELVVRANRVTVPREPDFGRVWDLETLNRLSAGAGRVKCGGEAGRVIMAGGLLEQGPAYPPFDTTDFALKRESEILPGTTRRLTNSVRWFGDEVSLGVRVFGGPLLKIKLKDSAALVRAAVYSIVSTRDNDKDHLGDFQDFYSLLSPRPKKPAQLVRWPETGVLLEGFPRCIPPVTIR